MPPGRLFSPLILLALAGCHRSEPEPADTNAAPAAATAVDAEPAAAPVAKTAPVTFEGFGPAHFGDAEEAVRQSWGRPFNEDVPSNEPCHMLLPQRPADAKGYMIAFMIENGRFVRFDVDSDRYTAPGGIKVGDSADAVMKAWSDQVESMPHKYVEGARYLTVTPRGGGESKLLFEVSPEARVQSWRIGIPPAVFYVEACS